MTHTMTVDVEGAELNLESRLKFEPHIQDMTTVAPVGNMRPLITIFLLLGILEPALGVEPPPMPSDKATSQIVKFGELALDAANQDFDAIHRKFIEASGQLGVECGLTGFEYSCLPQPGQKDYAFARISLINLVGHPTSNGRQVARLTAILARGIFVKRTKLAEIAFGGWSKYTVAGPPLPASDCLDMLQPTASAERARAILHIGSQGGGCSFPASLTVTYIM